MQPSDTVLRHDDTGGSTGFITGILVDGTSVCTFTKKEQLTAVALLD